MAALLASLKLALDAADKSPKTIIPYLDPAKRLEAYLATEGLPLEPIRELAGRRVDRTMAIDGVGKRSGAASGANEPHPPGY